MAVDVGRDQRVRAERLDHADGGRDAVRRDVDVLRADRELDARRLARGPGIVAPATDQLPSPRLFAGRKFIGGLPMNEPTKRAAGLR